MILPTYTPKSVKPTNTKVNDKIFAAKINETLLAQAVRVYLSNQRQGTKHAKTRGEVHGTGKKIYRQKGTGRARHGDRLAPIFVKGGVAHGPKGNENYTKKLPPTLRRQALISALSSQAKAKRILVVNKLDQLTKTKALNQVLIKIFNNQHPLALIVPNSKSSLIRLARNLNYVTPLTINQLTTYHVLKYPRLLITADSLPIIEKRLQ